MQRYLLIFLIVLFGGNTNAHYTGSVHTHGGSTSTVPGPGIEHTFKRSEYETLRKMYACKVIFQNGYRAEASGWKTDFVMHERVSVRTNIPQLNDIARDRLVRLLSGEEHNNFREVNPVVILPGGLPERRKVLMSLGLQGIFIQQNEHIIFADGYNAMLESGRSMGTVIILGFRGITASDFHYISVDGRNFHDHENDYPLEYDVNMSIRDDQNYEQYREWMMNAIRERIEQNKKARSEENISG